MTWQVIVTPRPLPQSEAVPDQEAHPVTATHRAAQPLATTPRPAAAGSPPLRRLRDIVRFDAAVGLTSGVALLVAAEPLSDLAGVDGTGPARAVGAFLVVYGLGLVALALGSDHGRLRGALVTAIADILWAVASVAVALTADLSGWGRALIAVQGLFVLGIGEVKLLVLRGARSA